MGKVIAFSNQKGGVGKTTTCVNMSACLASVGKKVLLLDLDPQGNATSSLGIEKEEELKSFYNIVVGEANIEDIVRRTKYQNLDIIPSDMNLAGAEIDLVQMVNREHVLKNALDKIKSSYDYITIDCPPSLGLLTVNALTSADSIIIPMLCEFLSLEALTQLMNTVWLVKQHLNSKLEIEGVVMTMKSARSNLANQVTDEIKKFFDKKVFTTSIPRNIRVAEAPSYGESVIDYDPKCKGAQAYMELTAEFLKRNKEKV
ncbi:MAG: ParA family protein [Clostridiales bacterium]|nr:ParA family protein [Clostridiales bacterium]